MLQIISNIFKPEIVQPPITPDNGEYILSKDQFTVFQTAFKRLATAKQITASDIILYNIIRGKPVDNGFTRITNKIKLFNGMNPRVGYNEAKGNLRHILNWKTQELIQRFDNFIPFTPVNPSSKRDTIRSLNPIIDRIYKFTN